MDAKTILTDVAEAFAHAQLEAVMIGNAAAALHGAPVTTMDIDFCVCESDELAGKLAAVAEHLDAQLLNYGAFFQIQAPAKELYLDFLCDVPGIAAFDELMQRSSQVSFDGYFQLRVAALEDVIHCKKISGQDKDLAVLPILERTLQAINEKKKGVKSRKSRQQKDSRT